jgi:hypothetical protein
VAPTEHMPDGTQGLTRLVIPQYQLQRVVPRIECYTLWLQRMTIGLTHILPATSNAETRLVKRMTGYYFSPSKLPYVPVWLSRVNGCRVWMSKIDACALLLYGRTKGSYRPVAGCRRTDG